MYKKNTAGNLTFALINATTGAALTGATAAGHVTLDQAAQAAVTGTFVEQGLGQYLFKGAAADFDANDCGFLFTATSAVPVNIHVHTTGADVTDGVRLGLTALPNTPCTTNASLLTSGTGTDQISVSSGRVDIGKFLGTASAGAAGYAGIDWGHVNAPTSAVGLTNTTISTSQQVASVSGAVGSVTGTVAANLTEVAGSAVPTPNVAGVPIVDIGYVVGAAATPGIATLALASGTAQAGGTATITLAASDTTASGLYAGNLVTLLTGPGARQSRTITANTLTGSDNVCTVDYAWTVEPTNATTYQIAPADGPAVNSSLQVATTASDPWGTNLPGAYAAGTAGYLVGTAIPASILTRSTYAGADTSGTTTLLTRLGANLTISGGKVAATLATSDVTGNLPANVIQIAGQTASAAAGVTFPASIGTSTYAGGAVASVTGAVGSVTASVTVGTNSDKTGYALSAAGLDPVVVETGLNARQSLAVIAAASAGTASGLNANAPVFKGAGVATTRISATTDSAGNRTAVTLTPPS